MYNDINIVLTVHGFKLFSSHLFTFIEMYLFSEYDDLYFEKNHKITLLPEIFLQVRGIGFKGIFSFAIVGVVGGDPKHMLNNFAM